jgi:septum formation protein
MLSSAADHLSQKRLVLASGSPRRKEIMELLELTVEIVPSTFEENLDKALFETVASYVEENAKQKALEVYNRLTQSDGEQLQPIVIGSDTVVALDGKILEKPKNEGEAKQMLASLSNRSHFVYSGVAFVLPPIAEAAEPEIVVFSEETAVTFAPLTDAMIDGYVKTGEPMDKAGAYGIQAKGGSFVTGINGCFYNVMGFPMHRFAAQLLALIEAGKV